MDRIAALRNVEDALAEYESGEVDLAELEERVVGTLRTYATEFEQEGLDAYRAEGPDDEVVVVAPDRESARERARDLLDAEDVEFDLEHVG